MNNATKEINYMNLLFDILWVIIALIIIIVGKKNKRVHVLRDNMIGMWKYSLFISVLSYVCLIIGNRNISYAKNIVLPIFLFFQCLVGFAIAKSIIGYEPLPIKRAFVEHKHQWRELIFMLLYGVITTIVIIVLGQIVPNFGEVNNTSNAIKILPQNKWLLFFTLLSGAGIAEETVYRLIFLSLFWKLTNKKWAAIFLSALLFGAYHLTPLNAMYKVYWGFPIHQFVSAAISGIVFGYIYTKRGYETAVVGHTFSDWLPILIFMK